MTVDQSYLITTEGSTSGTIQIRHAFQDVVTYQSVGTETYSVGRFVADATADTMHVRIGGSNGDGSGIVNSVRIEAVIPDRSPRGCHAIVHGRIRQYPVDEGAELACIAGFRGIDPVRYMSVPASSALDFGVGDFSAQFWFMDKVAGSTTTILSRANDAQDTELFGIQRGSASSIRHLSLWLNGTAFQLEGGAPADLWSHILFSRRDGELRAYLNGELIADGVANSEDITSDQPLFIGRSWQANGANENLRYALMRLSKSAPTDEQVRFIYESEKPLFAPNAKCRITTLGYIAQYAATNRKNGHLHFVDGSGQMNTFDGLLRVGEDLSFGIGQFDAQGEITARVGS